jgi:hypothetical protein
VRQEARLVKGVDLAAGARVRHSVKATCCARDRTGDIKDLTRAETRLQHP